ncbi:LysR family transcriptional regulator [Photobacterium kagoshimensis]|uniref:LysR family transcriptional regulator n=1 Tax=Photobacterium kagoshimensis TaxID=2910242 RepID=UPI003D11584E
MRYLTKHLAFLILILRHTNYSTNLVAMHKMQGRILSLGTKAVLNSLATLNLSELQAFMYTYELGSFAVVAQKYGKHASTYSRRVNNLELDLGLALFVRNGSHLTPTADGSTLYPPAKAILNEVEHFERRVQLCLEDNEATIKVAIDSTLNAFSPELTIAQIAEEFPATDVEVLSGNTQQVIAMLEQKEADVGLVLSSFDYPSDIINHKLFDFRFVRTMSPGYAKRLRLSLDTPIEPNVIRTMKQIVLAPINRLGVNTQNYSNHLLHVDNFHMAKSLAINGTGWANLPLVECQDALDKGELLEFQVEYDHDLEWSVDSIWLSDVSRGPVARRLVELFTNGAQ